MQSDELRITELEMRVSQLEQTLKAATEANGHFKLYVWYGVLSDYTSGHAWAIARSHEEAVDAIEKVYTYTRYDWGLPKVYDLTTMTEPLGFTLHGGG